MLNQEIAAEIKSPFLPSCPSVHPLERDLKVNFGSLSSDVFRKFSTMDGWEGSRPTQTRTRGHCMRL